MTYEFIHLLILLYIKCQPTFSEIEMSSAKWLQTNFQSSQWTSQFSSKRNAFDSPCQKVTLQHKKKKKKRTNPDEYAQDIDKQFYGIAHICSSLLSFRFLHSY